MPDQNPPLKIAVFGAGSIGCYLGGLLAHGGAAVTFIGRERFKRDLQTGGLTLSHFASPEIQIPADDFRFSLNPGDIADADIVLVTVKSQDTKDAGKTIAKHASPNALIISFQNGIHNAGVLRGVLPKHKVLGAMVPFNVIYKGVGQFHCGTEGDLYVQDLADDRFTHMLKFFTKSGQEIKAAEDIEAVLWGKLMLNLNNALNTLHGGTLITGLVQRPYREALARMIEEALGVLAGAGITPAQIGKAPPEKIVKILRLPTWLYKIIMKRLLKIDAAARSSMLDDLEVGRPTEIDYLQGEIVTLAKTTNQTAPINAAIMHATKSAFKVGKSPKLGGAAILALIKP